MTLERTYRYKDNEMLMAAKIVAANLNAQLSDLSMVRSNWTPEFVTDLQTRVENLMETYLGLDKKQALREATAALAAIQGPAMRDLQFLKTQIDVDFGKEADEITKNLGYDRYLKAARSGDQEAQIQLLYAFNKGMTDTLKADIVAKGTNVALIDRILGYAVQLSEANLVQETLKGTTKSISESAITAFNELYSEIIGICKIASAFYQYDEVLKAQFTFSRIVANMSTTGKSTPSGEVADTEQTVD